jgi:hypothetical protein
MHRGYPTLHDKCNTYFSVTARFWPVWVKLSEKCKTDACNCQAMGAIAGGWLLPRRWLNQTQRCGTQQSGPPLVLSPLRNLIFRSKYNLYNLVPDDNALGTILQDSRHMRVFQIPKIKDHFHLWSECNIIDPLTSNEPMRPSFRIS